MYDRTTAQGATFNMRGQLYRGHANATALFSSPVVSALGSELEDPVLVLAGTRRCALETCGKKKKRAPLLGLAKSIYYNLRILRPDIKCMPGVALLNIFLICKKQRA